MGLGVENSGLHSVGRTVPARAAESAPECVALPTGSASPPLSPVPEYSVPIPHWLLALRPWHLGSTSTASSLPGPQEAVRTVGQQIPASLYDHPFLAALTLRACLCVTPTAYSLSWASSSSSAVRTKSAHRFPYPPSPYHNLAATSTPRSGPFANPRSPSLRFRVSNCTSLPPSPKSAKPIGRPFEPRMGPHPEIVPRAHVPCSARLLLLSKT